MADITAPESRGSGMDIGLRFNPPFPEIPLAIALNEMIGRTVFLDPRRIMAYKGQPRKKFRGIPGLAKGIKSIGQKTTILVFPIEHAKYDAVLIEGERRTRAALLAGVMIRAEIRPRPKDDHEHFVDSFVANFDRAGLTSIETVHAIEKLLADSHSYHDIAEMTGMTVTWVSQYASLSKLDPEVLKLIDEDGGEQHDLRTGRKLRRKTVLPLSIALLLTHVSAHESQCVLAEKIIEGHLSIDSARSLIEKHLSQKGEILRSRKKSPDELFRLLGRATRKYLSSLDPFLDMKGTNIQTMMSRQSVADREDLAEEMRELAVHLNGLADDVWKK